MVSAEDINYRYYKAMRFRVNRNKLDDIRYRVKYERDAVSAFDMMQWTDNGPDSLKGMMLDARGQYHEAYHRWNKLLYTDGLQYILKNTALQTWLEIGLRAPVLYAAMEHVEQQPHNVAPYLMLMRWLQLLEMHANGYLVSSYHLDRWVNADDGYGPCIRHEHDSPLYGSTQLQGMVACSFLLNRAPVIVTVPFSEISDRDTEYVLVMTRDLERFMPLVNSALLASDQSIL